MTTDIKRPGFFKASAPIADWFCEDSGGYQEALNIIWPGAKFDHVSYALVDRYKVINFWMPMKYSTYIFEETWSRLPNDD